jgi:hypothetical protein
VGTHTIRLVADDGYSGVDPDDLQVTVRDTTAPVIEQVVANPPTSWPPNHKMVPVTISVTARDTCDPHVVSRIASVVSSDNGARGAGKPSASDWEITGPLTVQLSAERAGTGAGRDYVITVEAADGAGNKTSMPVIVRIPHN